MTDAPCCACAGCAGVRRARRARRPVARRRGAPRRGPIGASGSGKSTLLRCVDLLEDVDDGVIEPEGQDITDPRLDARTPRARIGMVFQSYNLFPHLRVLDNVTLAPRLVHRTPRAQAESAEAIRPGARRPRRQGARVPRRRPVRRAAAARRDRPRAARQARRHAARRGHQRTRPPVRRRGARPARRASSRPGSRWSSRRTRWGSREVADEVCFLHAGRVHERGVQRAGAGRPAGGADARVPAPAARVTPRHRGRHAGHERHRAGDLPPTRRGPALRGGRACDVLRAARRPAGCGRARSRPASSRGRP